MTRLRRTGALTVLIAVMMTVSACTGSDSAKSEPETSTTSPSGSPSESAAQPLLATMGLEGKSGREVVEQLDRLDAKRPLRLAASVRSNELLLSDGKTEAAMPLDGDQFYLSMAPYENVTHPCHFHNLGTCQGELVSQDVHVKITTDSGDVLVDEATKTYANGFIGFWIPKNTSGKIVITKDGKRAESPFASTSEGATCVTTLKLV